jgi:hypothetical protein
MEPRVRHRQTAHDQPVLQESWLPWLGRAFKDHSSHSLPSLELQISFADREVQDPDSRQGTASWNWGDKRELSTWREAPYPWYLCLTTTPALAQGWRTWVGEGLASGMTSVSVTARRRAQVSRPYYFYLFTIIQCHSTLTGIWFWGKKALSHC